MTAAYPASLLNWTQRVNSQTVFAADPNTLAAEIDAIEQFVGVNPQIESSALTGATKTFNNLSARVSDAMLQRGHPYVSIARTTAFNVPHTASGDHVVQNPYGKTISGWAGYLNGSGTVTVKDAGLWIINAHQIWAYTGSGWVQQQLLANSSLLDRDVFSYSQFPGSGSNAYGERFIGQNGHTRTMYLGRLSAGTVISVASGNYTNTNPLAVNSMSLSMYFLRP